MSFTSSIKNNPVSGVGIQLPPLPETPRDRLTNTTDNLKKSTNGYKYEQLTLPADREISLADHVGGPVAEMVKTDSAASGALKESADVFSRAGDMIVRAFNKIKQYDFKKNIGESFSNAKEHIAEAGEHIIRAKNMLKEGLQGLYRKEQSHDLPSKEKLKEALTTVHQECLLSLKEARAAISELSSHMDETNSNSPDLKLKTIEAENKLAEAKAKMHSVLDDTKRFIPEETEKLKDLKELKALAKNIRDSLITELDNAQKGLALVKKELEKSTKPEGGDSLITSQSEKVAEKTEGAVDKVIHPRADIEDPYKDLVEDKDIRSEAEIDKGKASSTQKEAPIKEKSLTDEEKLSLIKQFNDLAIIAKQLKDKQSIPDEGKKQKLVYSQKNGLFEAQDKGIGIGDYRGRSDQAKGTALEVNKLLRSLLKEKCFTVNDEMKLAMLNVNLKTLLGDTFAYHPAIKAEFDQIFNDINAEQQAGFPEKLAMNRTYIDHLLEKHSPLTLENIHESLFEPGQDELQEDFVKGGPWIADNGKKLTGADNLENLMDKMIAVFEGTDVGKKEMALKLLQKLVDREVINPNNGKLQQVFAAVIAGSDGNESIQASAKDIDLTIAQKKEAQAQMLTQTDSIMTYQAIGKEDINVTDKLNEIASGTLEKGEREAFIHQFAHDLTTIDANLFKSIKPSEFHGKAWEKNDKATSPNVLACIDQFNNTSHFFIDQLLQPNLAYGPYIDRKDKSEKIMESAQQRQRLAETFLEMANYMITEQTPRNYTGAMAILSALNNAAISRLAKDPDSGNKDQPANLLTKESQKLYASLSTILDPKNSYQALRDQLRQDQGKTGTASHPFIPVLIMYIGNFTLAADGNPDSNELSGINLEKAKMMANYHTSIESAQRNLSLSQELHMTGLPKALKQSPHDEEVFYNRSMNIRPRSEQADRPKSVLSGVAKAVRSRTFERRKDKIRDKT